MVALAYYLLVLVMYRLVLKHVYKDSLYDTKYLSSRLSLPAHRSTDNNGMVEGTKNVLVIYQHQWVRQTRDRVRHDAFVRLLVISVRHTTSKAFQHAECASIFDLRRHCSLSDQDSEKGIEGSRCAPGEHCT
jgi:hypothetical protein